MRFGALPNGSAVRAGTDLTPDPSPCQSLRLLRRGETRNQRFSFSKQETNGKGRETQNQRFPLS
jgi:hypothetical protein